MGRIWRNYIETRRKSKILYRKGTGVLLKNILGNIKKKKLEAKKLAKGNKWGLGVLKNPTSAI